MKKRNYKKILEAKIAVREELLNSIQEKIFYDNETCTATLRQLGLAILINDWKERTESFAEEMEERKLLRQSLKLNAELLEMLNEEKKLKNVEFVSDKIFVEEINRRLADGELEFKNGKISEKKDQKEE